MNALQPEVAALLRIEINLAEGPSRREAGAIVERRIHLEVAAVVLHLVGPSESACVVAVGQLRADGMSVAGRSEAGL